jgi:hypothetical protein
MRGDRHDGESRTPRALTRRRGQRRQDFLDYALGSLREAESWIQDEIEFGDFQEEQCRRAFWFGERCFTATLRLKHSQERYAVGGDGRPVRFTDCRLAW